MRHGKIDHKRHRVHNGGDERRGHDGRVHPAGLCNERQHAADGFCHDHGAQHRQRHSEGHHLAAGIGEDQPNKIHRAEHHAHQQADTQLLPQHPGKIPQGNLVHRKAADDQRAALAARVAAGIRKHGNKRDEQRHRGNGRLIPTQDTACDHAGDHQHQQPYDAVPCQGKHARFQIRLLRWGHGGHLLEVLGGLLLHNVHRVVHGNDAHQTSFRVYHGQRQEAVPLQQPHGLLLVRPGGDGDDAVLHHIADELAVPRQQQAAHRHHAQQPAAGANHIAGVDGLPVLSGAADVLNGLLHRHRGAQICKFRRHNAAGGMLGILEELVDQTAHLRCGVLQDALDHIGGHVLQHIHRVVHVQVLHDDGQFRIRRRSDDELLHLRLQLCEHVGRHALGQRAESQHGLLTVQQSQKFCNIHFVQLQQGLAQSLKGTFFQQRLQRCKIILPIHLCFLLLPVCRRTNTGCLPGQKAAEAGTRGPPPRQTKPKHANAGVQRAQPALRPEKERQKTGPKRPAAAGGV